MTTKGPFDEHTEPAFDDAVDDLEHDESPTETVARELLTQLVAHRASRNESAHNDIFDGATRTDAPRPLAPGSGEGEPTRQVKPPRPPSLEDQTRPVDAISLSLGDATSDGLARLHRHHAGEHAAEQPAGDFEVEVTSPGLMPIPKTGADALKEKRGDIAQLLASIAPFLWSLEAAEKWVRDHAEGDAEGESHARALALLARILGQLQARIDEAAKQIREPPR